LYNMVDTNQKFFTLISNSGEARAGLISTDHGAIETPIFMPVGTQGAVKAMEHRSLHEVGAQIILGNTYHLYLRPGTTVLEKMGGLHGLSGWHLPILTDSGGYQVFSLRDLNTISEEGVVFNSHLDGSKHFFTPEGVVDIQRSIGSDIFMVLDECTPHPATHVYARLSMERTVRWAKRASDHASELSPLYGNRQFQFAIGQGSVYTDLRRECMDRLVDLNLPGYAIGGLSVGESADEMYEMTHVSTQLMPQDKPRYLMGVGTPENILRCIGLGVDMFDCVMPTRNARNGTLFTTTGRVNIKNSKWKQADEPVDANIDCHTSSHTSMAYLRHLFVANEILGLMLATAQNVALYLWLVRTARRRILEGTYEAWCKEIIPVLNQVR
jgi:queuine tRNA-ribosyltransferase